MKLARFLGLGLTYAGGCELGLHLAFDNMFGLIVAPLYYTAMLSLLFLLHREVERRHGAGRRYLLAVLGLSGVVITLLLEWLVVGNTPAGNPDASQWGWS